MPAETRLLLIRHAHADADGRLCGWFDAPLSRHGLATLRELEAGVRHVPAPEALYTSPLGRARSVATALGSAWDVDPLVLDGVREISCGDFDGLPLDVVRSREPELWARNLAQDDDDFAWPGGESYRDFRARVLHGLDAVATRHAGGLVAVVTHAGVVAQVVGMLAGRPAAAWEPDRPDLLSATTVAWSSHAPREVVRFNESRWWTGAMPRVG